MPSLLDAFQNGTLSPGDGYVAGPSPDGSATLMNLLRGLLGPTQQQAQMQNMANSAQIVPISADEAARATAQQQPQLGANPQIVPISADEAQRAYAQQGLNAPSAQPPILRAPVMPAQSGYGGTSTGVASGGPSLVSSLVNVPPVAQVNAEDDPNTPGLSPRDMSFNPTGGGLIGALQQGASDPGTAKSLLSSFADQAKSVGEKLTNLSPNASQALIASGLTMLAGNDGTRNLGQLVGLGGISGLNSYNANREQQAQMALAAQKLQQTAQQQGFENALAARKQLWEEGKPVSVGLDQSLINPRTGQAVVQAQPGVARTAEVQGPDGNTYTVQLDRGGNIVGQPLLKSNPNVGPLGDPQQKTVNDAQTAAASARQTYQNTAYLANQLATAPDFASGFGASVNDTLTKLTGNKDAGQQLRGQLSQFANSSILGELPPGSASDKDIQLVRNGVPSDTASKETWQSYLSAVGRVQQVAALYQNAKSDYVTANRGDLGPLKRDATVNGVQYPAGTTFAQALTGQAPQQQQSSSGGAVPYSAALAEARRRGLIK